MLSYRVGQMVACISEEFEWCKAETSKPHKGLIYTISGMKLNLTAAIVGNCSGIFFVLDELPGKPVDCDCGNCLKLWEVENFKPVEKDFSDDVKKLLAPDPNAPVSPEPVTV
jgi:hypothetical protein